MKLRGKVLSVDDPDNIGRIRVELLDLVPGLADTPWVWPCSPFAGPGYGFFCPPQVGDRVWVERAANGHWIFSGFFWTKACPKPASGAADVRVFRTPAGHQVSFAEGGDITITHAGGSTITLAADGSVNVMAVGDITLNGSDARVVTTKCICAYTGNPHPQGSATVKAKGL